MIEKTLSLIKEQLGLDLKLCPYFTGIRVHKARKYFNIILDERTSLSRDYISLERYAKKSKLIYIEPNGVDRVAIFPLFDYENETNK